jgi:hypothetical protein
MYIRHLCNTKFHITDVTGKWQVGNLSRVPWCSEATHGLYTDVIFKMILIHSRYSLPVMVLVQSCLCTVDASRVLHLVYSRKFFFAFMKWINFSRPFVSRVILAASISCVVYSDCGCPALSSGYQSSAVLPPLRLYLNPVQFFTYYQRYCYFVPFMLLSQLYLLLHFFVGQYVLESK